MAQARSKPVTTGTVILASPGTFRGLTLSSAAGATVTVYDNASAASGVVLASWIIAANGSVHLDIVEGVRCENGIYFDASATVAGAVRYG